MAGCHYQNWLLVADFEKQAFLVKTRLCEKQRAAKHIQRGCLRLFWIVCMRKLLADFPQLVESHIYYGYSKENSIPPKPPPSSVFMFNHITFLVFQNTNGMQNLVQHLFLFLILTGFPQRLKCPRATGRIVTLQASSYICFQ